MILVGYAIWGLISVAGLADFVANYAGPVLGLLGTGMGILVALLIAVLLIVWAVNTEQGETAKAGAESSPPSPARPEDKEKEREHEREHEQLRDSFRRVQLERDRLRARLSDPTAAKKLEDERLRRRCMEVSHELQNFMRIGQHQPVDRNQLVARFQQRHEWKVNEVRDRLDEQAWLTPQERDTLTFRADDHSYRIDEIAAALRDIGRGH